MAKNRIPDIHFSESTKKFYITQSVSCFNCAELLESVALFKIPQAGHETTIKFYCSHCFKEFERSLEYDNSQFFDIQQRNIIYIVNDEDLPKDTNLIFDWRVRFQASRGFLDSQSASRKLASSVCLETIDRTTQAKNGGSLEGAQIGKELHELELEKRDRLLSVKELNHELRDLAISIPLIPDQGTYGKIEFQESEDQRKEIEGGNIKRIEHLAGKQVADTTLN